MSAVRIAFISPTSNISCSNNVSASALWSLVCSFKMALARSSVVGENFLISASICRKVEIKFR